MRDISSIIILSSNATIKAEKVKELDDETSGRWPDGCFMTDLTNRIDSEDYDTIDCGVKGCETENENDAKFCKECGGRLERPNQEDLKVDRLDWNGDGSGNTWHPVFVKKIAPHIVGDLEAIAVLGTSDDEEPVKLMGIQVHNGIFTRCEVDCRLRPVRAE